MRMGNTDAHLPHSIGIVWNAVFAENGRQEAIVRALKLGHSFVSDAPLIHIGWGEARMGDTASTPDRSQNFEITIADSRVWLPWPSSPTVKNCSIAISAAIRIGRERSLIPGTVERCARRNLQPRRAQSVLKSDLPELHAAE